MLTIEVSMVNDTSSTRTELLELLRKADTPVSGTALGLQLGISRVAVRKHIIKLIDEGFFIETTRNGYRLSTEPDFPAPSDFDARQVHIHDEVESTMDEALRYTDNGQEEVQFFLARTQRAGRGRNRRTWRSPDGGLYLTVVFRPRLPAAYISLYVIQAGLFLSDVLRDLYSVECSFRWPNDLYVADSKLGGLLLELSGPSEDPARAFLGIGLNVCSKPGISSMGKRRVTSLQEELSGETDRIPGTKQLFTAIKTGT